MAEKQLEQTKGKSSGQMERSEQGDVSSRRMPQRWTPYGGSPFGLMRRMMEDFERMFEEPFLGFGGLTRGGVSQGVAIDVFERGNQLVVRADVPGYSKEEIKLEVTSEGLVLEGERKEEHEEKEGGFYRKERTYGSFRRLVPLPEGINLDTVDAKMKNGVLEVCFDLPEQRTERKRIQISEGTETKSKAVH